ncbi:hypothetical protein [Acinetobacter junii]|uniref:hypothetical protein n=1 Tax=Acinetobacter junii TaxID=40215 RepID=UPI00321229D7
MRKIILILILGIGVLALWIFFPIIFRFLVLHVLVTPPFTPEVFASLGPIGDIFGGLTALFTSATLIIVMYSAYLQRQANEDARKAMADQLKEARTATENQLDQAKSALRQQLDQAREATERQIENAKVLSRIELEQIKATTTQQLALAQASHDAQMKETKNSFFISQFYSLLNYKNESIKNLVLRDMHDKRLIGYEIFTILKRELVKNISNKYSKEIDVLDAEKIRFEYDNIIKKLNNDHLFYEIFTYFEIYTSLFELVNKADIDKDQKNFFYNLIRQSSTPSEQITLFFLAPIWERLYESLEGCRIFNSFSTLSAEKFALKFYNKSYFYTQEWYEFFDKQQNPA